MGTKTSFKIRNFSIILIFLDIFIVSASWIGAFWLRYMLNEYIGIPINPYHVYLSGLPYILVLWLLVSASFGLYRRKKEISRFEDLHSFLKSVLLGALLVMSLAFIFKEFDFGRLVIFFFVGSNFFLLGISRVIVRRGEDLLRRKGLDQVNTIILGAGEIGVRAMQKLIDHSETGYNIVGFLDNYQEIGTTVGKLKVLGRLDDIRKIVIEKEIEEVFIAIPYLAHDRILELVMKCESFDVNFKIVTDLFGVITGDADFDVIEDFPIVELKNSSATNMFDPGRRIFDLLVASIGSIVALPLLTVIAVAIKMDTPGIVLFSQDRVGLKGKVFKLYKFRTMFKEVEKYEVSPTSRKDKRITKLGSFLRKTSLDELPQLINVLKGDMSIVGPRPEMPFIVNTYEEWQRRRLDVKPGITGLWQILGRKDLPLHENLEYDFYYIKNRSVLLDFTIFIKTIVAVLFQKGAY